MSELALHFLQNIKKWPSSTMWALSTSRVKTKLFCCQRDIGSKILVSNEFLSNSWASQCNLVLETKRLKFCTNIDHKCHFATKQVNFLKQNALFFLLAGSFLLQLCVTNIQYFTFFEKHSKEVTKTVHNKEWISCWVRQPHSRNLEFEFFLASTPSAKCWNFLKYFKLWTFWTKHLLAEFTFGFVMLPTTQKMLQFAYLTQNSSYCKWKTSFTLLRHHYSLEVQNSFCSSFSHWFVDCFRLHPLSALLILGQNRLTLSEHGFHGRHFYLKIHQKYIGMI